MPSVSRWITIPRLDGPRSRSRWSGAGGDFPAAAEDVVNAIILVTDGLETCDGDPCAAATALKEGDAQVTVYVVGLGLDEEELRITSCIAENSGGQIVGAQNAEELSEALFSFLEELQVVVTTGFLEIESIGGLYPLANVACTGQPASDSDPEGSESFTYTFTTDTNVVEAPTGICDVSWTNPSGQVTAIQVNIEADRTTRIRGSILKFPHGAGEIYILKAQDGTVIWQDQIEQGDYVWVLPGIYTLDLEELVGNPILISFTVQTLPGSVTQVEILHGAVGNRAWRDEMALGLSVTPALFDDRPATRSPEARWAGPTNDRRSTPGGEDGRRHDPSLFTLAPSRDRNLPRACHAGVRRGQPPC